MTRDDHRLPRLFVDETLNAGSTLSLDRDQANYLGSVLRRGPGDAVLVFNGRDGEWRARIAGTRKALSLDVEAPTRPQAFGQDLHYLFAPLKHARLDYMAQKATEMGVSRLLPVITRRTQVTRVNLDRLRANAIEAAEQCELLAIPEIGGAEPLEAALAGLEADRTLIFCDEEAPQADPLKALAAAQGEAAFSGKLAVLIGPEGGFSDEERRMLLAHSRIVRLSLGPRILRADTAAVVALALVQAVLGDFRPANP